ncbi:unnamed protein product [Toxocara canis]|uniref:PITH domain-containing protein n=1 Tax=Toxocara canis TaxID=6265 RepID=A0A183VFA4_TOXCA|nr:unnamed protein product [Toxocara canis]
MGVVQREPNVDNKEWHQPDHLSRAESNAKIKICGGLQEENCCDLDPNNPNDPCGILVKITSLPKMSGTNTSSEVFDVVDSERLDISPSEIHLYIYRTLTR